MSEINKHTPGPWKAVQRTFGYPEVEGGPERKLWDVVGPHGGVVAMGTIYNVDEADARLIAAAPDLLDACEQAAEWLESWASAEPYLSIIRAAIAKATEAI